MFLSIVSGLQHWAMQIQRILTHKLDHLSPQDYCIMPCTEPHRILTNPATKKPLLSPRAKCGLLSECFDQGTILGSQRGRRNVRLSHFAEQ